MDYKNLEVFDADMASYSDAKKVDDVSLICAADVTPEAINWLWNGWLAKGKFHIFAGMAGTGKTTISIALASIVTNGGKFPDGQKSPVGSVLIFSGEDSIKDTLTPRLIASGADLSKVHFIGDTFKNKEIQSFDPATDMQALLVKASSIKDLALLIIDPIVNAVAGDSHKNGEVRRALQPIVEFGEKLNCAVLGITHFSKGGQGKDPTERVTGSLAFAALARVVLATGKIDDGDKCKRIFCRTKNNMGKDDGGFEYNVKQKELSEGIVTSYVSFGDAVEGSARELLAEPDNRFGGGEGGSAVDDAKAFLIELLSGGEMASKSIENEAKEADISKSSLRRAKNSLNIKVSKSKLDGRWYWRLFNAEIIEGAQHAHINNVNTLSNMPNINNDVMEF